MTKKMGRPPNPAYAALREGKTVFFPVPAATRGELDKMAERIRKAASYSRRAGHTQHYKHEGQMGILAWWTERS